MLDGMPGDDIDDTTRFLVSVSMDAIQEVSVKATAYQAEYGRLPSVACPGSTLRLATTRVYGSWRSSLP